MTKIMWVTDFDCMAGTGGGAELSDRAVIMDGIRRGYDIYIITPDSPVRVEVYTADIAVISNAALFPLSFLSKLLDRLLVVNYIHDYFPQCAWRLFYPDLTKCKTTCRTHQFAHDALTKAALNVFLSPLHYRVWHRVIPEVEFTPHHLHPSPIDTDAFRPVPQVPKIANSVLGVNVLLKFKGMNNVLEYAKAHPELTFTFCGGKDSSAVLPSNANYVGEVAYSEMPGMYVQAERMIHLPSGPEPFARAVAEAKLCGTGVICNQLVGALSYPEYKRMNRDEYAAWISDSPRRFWAKVKQEVM